MTQLRIVNLEEEQRRIDIECQLAAIAKLREEALREIDLQVSIKAVAGTKITNLREYVIKLDGREYKIKKGIMPTEPLQSFEDDEPIDE